MSAAVREFGRGEAIALDGEQAHRAFGKPSQLSRRAETHLWPHETRGTPLGKARHRRPVDSTMVRSPPGSIVVSVGQIQRATR